MPNIISGADISGMTFIDTPELSIVSSGLVMYLDAGNSSSYSGTGSTWTDLSGNSRNATLVNGPTYSSSNNGYLIFDGTNDYASVSVPALTSYSLCFWIYVISLPASGEKQIFGAPSDIASISLAYTGGTWKWLSWSGSLARTGVTVSTGTWYNFIMLRSGSTTQFYINNALSSTFANGVNINSGTGYFCDVTVSGGRYLNCRLSNIIFYNKSLTSDEITQNYNFFRGRFGL